MGQIQVLLKRPSAFLLLSVGIASCDTSPEPAHLVVGHGDFALLFASRGEEVLISDLAGTQFYLHNPNGIEGRASLSGPNTDLDALCSNPVVMKDAPEPQYFGTDRPMKSLVVESIAYDAAAYSPLISRELEGVEARSVNRIDGVWLIADQSTRWTIVSAFSFSKEAYSSGTPGDFGGLFVFDASGSEPKLVGSELSIVGQPFDAVEDWQDDVVAAFRDENSSGIEIVVQTDYEQGTAYTRYRLTNDRVIALDEAGCGG
jgi:hypothetical protein